MSIRKNLRHELPSPGGFRIGVQVIFLGNIRHEVENPEIFDSRKGGVGKSVLCLFQSIPGQGHHPVSVAEIHGACGACLHACGQQPVVNPVNTHGALGNLPGVGLHPGDIIRAGLYYLDSIHVFQFVRIQNRPGLLINENASGHRILGSFQAGGGKTVSTLVGKEIPHGFVVRSFMFLESNQFKRVEREIFRVLHASPVDGLCGRRLVPLLAGDLAAPARRTDRRVDKKRFPDHLTHSFIFFSR